MCERSSGGRSPSVHRSRESVLHAPRVVSTTSRNRLVPQAPHPERELSEHQASRRPDRPRGRRHHRSVLVCSQRSTADPAAPTTAAASALRHPQRRRRLVAGRRPGGLGRRLPDRQPRRRPSTTTRPAPAPVARPSSPAASTSPAPTRALKDDELAGEFAALRRRHQGASTCRSTSPRSPSSSTSTASTSSTSTPPRSPASSRATSPSGTTPAIAALNEDATLPDRPHHRRAPLGRLGHHQELHRLPRPGRPEDVWTAAGTADLPVPDR